jgi:PKD repeat protein
MYQWNFKDNTPVQEGIRINHIFKKPGTYTVELKKGLKNKTSMQVVDTLKIDIMPLSGYSLPHADFVANGKPIVKGFINFTELNNTKIVFEASDSSSMKDSMKYIWDFSDGQSAEGKKINYTYKGKSNSVTAILRVIDANNLMDETYSIIAFKNLTPVTTVIPKTAEQTNSVLKFIWEILNFIIKIKSLKCLISQIK